MVKSSVLSFCSNKCNSSGITFLTVFLGGDGTVRSKLDLNSLKQLNNNDGPGGRKAGHNLIIV